jgi:uncharacterized protein DUF6152
MKRLLSFTISFLPLVFGTQMVYSHHSFSGVYDGSRVVTVSGVVTQFKFVNPHALMLMDVTDESGKVSKWTVEFAGRLNLAEIGWTADSIKAKDRVTVTGNPTHAAGLPRLAFVKIVKGDGTVLLPANAERSNAIDEERRQRALARDKQK